MSTKVVVLPQYADVVATVLWLNGLEAEVVPNPYQPEDKPIMVMGSMKDPFSGPAFNPDGSRRGIEFEPFDERVMDALKRAFSPEPPTRATKQ